MWIVEKLKFTRRIINRACVFLFMQCLKFEPIYHCAHCKRTRILIKVSGNKRLIASNLTRSDNAALITLSSSRSRPRKLVRYFVSVRESARFKCCHVNLASAKPSSSSERTPLFVSSYRPRIPYHCVHSQLRNLTKNFFTHFFLLYFQFFQINLVIKSFCNFLQFNNIVFYTWNKFSGSITNKIENKWINLILFFWICYLRNVWNCWFQFNACFLVLIQ